MVLPAPAAHAAPATDAWLRRLSLILRLAERGVLVLVDRARPERLGELVRHVLREQPDADVLTEALNGFGAAHADLVKVNHDPAYVTRAKPTRAGKVALISGGGAGHEPLHAGFVGTGMLDAACPGQVFTSPTPDQMSAAAQAVDSGAGVLFIVKNYEGDVMNFEMATEILEGKHATVITNDDVAVQPENLVEQLLAEAVHDGHDDDKRGDAEQDAKKREASDDRDEAFLAPGTQVAQSQHPFERGKRPGVGGWRGHVCRNPSRNNVPHQRPCQARIR